MGKSYVNFLTFLPYGTVARKSKDTFVNLNTITYLKPLGRFSTKDPKINLELFELYDVGNQKIVITSADEIEKNIRVQRLRNYIIEKQGKQNVVVEQNTFLISDGFNPQKIVPTQALRKNKEGKLENIDLFEVYYFNGLVMIVDTDGYYTITGSQPITTTTTTLKSMGYNCTPKGCVGEPGGQYTTLSECEKACA